ncbi:ubiquitin-like protein 4A [Aricia agestis]|uniref:ubiquitin-like protein 4A n=1 Tax=Aricia agestis TaxID=91739 RepID=UPI001C20784C|nr:ubiquitin-like protein 4A [Aricia agestis]
MNITIKQLKGGECKLEVDPSTKILDIKKNIYTKLSIPVEDQKLVLMGRTLADEQTVSTYPSIKDGTKLNLVVKKPESLMVASVKYFKQCGMSEQDANTAAKKFIRLIEEKFQKFSWDDIEQMSVSCLIDESGEKLPTAEEPEPDCNDTFGL